MSKNIELSEQFKTNLEILSKANSIDDIKQSRLEFKKPLTWAKKHASNLDYYLYYDLFHKYFGESKQQEKPSIEKTDQRYIKRICSNQTLKEEDKIKILQKNISLNEQQIKEFVESKEISLNSSQFAKAKLHVLNKSKRYIISSAQTASPVNIQLLNNIKSYAQYIDAEIGIIATRYRNPTSIWKEEGDVWDSLVLPYLTAQQQKLHNNLVLLADLKIQATAPNPTNGIESFGGHASVIVGSPRIEMRSVPVLESQEQKFLWSTGSVTIPSFTDTVAGGKAAVHHCYGFLIVEIENENVVHVRNVSAHENGSFNDLIYRVEDGDVKLEETSTLVWGDSHFAQKDEKVTNAFKKICNDLDIKHSVLHDVFDAQSMNVHNLKDPITKLQLYKDGKDSLDKELKQMSTELKWFEDNMESTVVVASNHDDMIDRVIKTTTWKDHSPINAVIFHKLESYIVKEDVRTGVIGHIINKKFKKVKALTVDDSYNRFGVELGLHGHIGPNGSKGNSLSFSRLSGKTIIGHSHSPSIKWGCYQVGISCAMKHGYNKGLSGWAYAGVTLNKHGKRQMIILNKKSLTYTTLY